MKFKDSLSERRSDGQAVNSQAGPGSGNGSAGAFFMLENFRAYQNSVMFYHDCEQLKCAKHLHDQLSRAASSISLNLSEGSSQSTSVNRRRFYHMALGSTR